MEKLKKKLVATLSKFHNKVARKKFCVCSNLATIEAITVLSFDITFYCYPATSYGLVLRIFMYGKFYFSANVTTRFTLLGTTFIKV